MQAATQPPHPASNRLPGYVCCCWLNSHSFHAPATALTSKQHARSASVLADCNISSLLSEIIIRRILWARTRVCVDNCIYPFEWMWNVVFLFFVPKGNIWLSAWEKNELLGNVPLRLPVLDEFNCPRHRLQDFENQDCSMFVVTSAFCNLQSHFVNFLDNSVFLTTFGKFK
jgi:hypothetical protein